MRQRTSPSACPYLLPVRTAEGQRLRRIPALCSKIEQGTEGHLRLLFDWVRR